MNLSAVLLAGGESRRMGQDKATILFRGQPLWEHQLDVLRSLAPAEILVSARTDPAWRPADVLFVADAQPSRGPLSGITAALSHATNNHLLVLGIDMPFMGARYLRDLCAKIRPGVGVVPMIDDRAEPLAAVYPREAEIDFTRALSGKDFLLQPLVAILIAARKIEPVEVATRDAGLFRNLNEPADLESRFSPKPRRRLP
jgi:molybdopterin-guanine dinucleotide biosynthesis protein A